MQQRLHQRKAAGWPAVTADIHWGHADNVGSRPFPLHWAEITCSFYAGEFRSGTYARKFRREADAEEFIRQTKGKPIQVHYQEADPEQSVLLDRDLEMIALLKPQSG